MLLSDFTSGSVIPFAEPGDTATTDGISDFGESSCNTNSLENCLYSKCRLKFQISSILYLCESQPQRLMARIED